MISTILIKFSMLISKEFTMYFYEYNNNKKKKDTGSFAM